MLVACFPYLLCIYNFGANNDFIVPLQRNSGDIYGCFCQRPHMNQPTYLTDLTWLRVGRKTFLLYTMLKVSFSDNAFVGAYPNQEAFAEAVKLASRHEQFNCVFDLVDGYEVVKITTKTTSRFALQLNETTVKWLFEYLKDGVNNNFDIDATSLIPSDESDGNTYRKHMLQYICEKKAASSVQFTPEFRERTTGKVTALANFRFGTIYFSVDRDEEMKTWLAEREARGE